MAELGLPSRALHALPVSSCPMAVGILGARGPSIAEVAGSTDLRVMGEHAVRYLLDVGTWTRPQPPLPGPRFLCLAFPVCCVF